jgi:hypothetical protein
LTLQFQNAPFLLVTSSLHFPPHENGKKLWEALGYIATMAATFNCVCVSLRGCFCVGKLEFCRFFLIYIDSATFLWLHKKEIMDEEKIRKNKC